MLFFRSLSWHLTRPHPPHLGFEPAVWVGQCFVGFITLSAHSALWRHRASLGFEHRWLQLPGGWSMAVLIKSNWSWPFLLLLFLLLTLLTNHSSQKRSCCLHYKVFVYNFQVATWQGSLPLLKAQLNRPLVSLLLQWCKSIVQVETQNQRLNLECNCLHALWSCIWTSKTIKSNSLKKHLHTHESKFKIITPKQICISLDYNLLNAQG